MEGNKLDLTSKPPADSAATYKVIPEADMEEDAVTRPKSLVKLKPDSPETDGADEKMLPKEDKVVELKLSPNNEKQNGDAKLDIGDLKTAFVGLTKEELMKYANDPFWVRLRWFLFITFWILWGVMLLGAILIILAAPKCDPPPPKTWWEKGPLVELESDVEATELTAVKEKGVTGVIISWSEDTYTTIDETHDFVKALKKYKEADIKVIIDLEPGTSTIWFNKSESNDPLFSDYYIWKPSKTVDAKDPPNNWLTVQNKSSWIYSEIRKEFYYSPKSGSPHLNFRNSNITEAFSNIIKKFINFGANGIRLRGVPFLLVDSTFEDEVPKSNAPNFGLSDYGFYAHTKTENLLDLAPLLQQWNTIVKNLTDNGPFMVAEDLNNIEAYRVNNSYVVDLPSQSHLFGKPNSTAVDLITVLTSTFKSDNISWPLWKINSSNDVSDIVTYLLPGTPLIKPNSTVNKDLLKIRDSPSIMRGTFDFHSINNGTVLAFVRVTPGNPGILVAINPTSNRTVVNFPTAISVVSEEVTVQLLSKNYNESEIQVNVKHKADKIPISPQSALVLSYVPK